jgi:putative membrane protein
MKQYIKIVCMGFCMGTVDTIPGVSGGTVALLFRIYQRLINAIGGTLSIKTIHLIRSGNWQGLWHHIDGSFLVSLGTGIAIGIITMAHLIGFVLSTYPPQTWAFFFGMVLCSTFLVAHTIKKWSLTYIALFILAAIAAWFFVQITAITTPSTWWFLFFCGMTASMAMILPGVSGSFLLLVLGQYATVLTAVKELNIFVLLPVALGAIVGLGLFSHLLKYVLAHYHDRTIAMLTGLMLGSTWKLWPWKMNLTDINSMNIRFDLSYDSIVLTSFILGGIVLTWALHFISNKTQAL